MEDVRSSFWISAVLPNRSPEVRLPMVTSTVSSAPSRRRNREHLGRRFGESAATSREAPIAPAMLRGRQEPTRLHVEAEGHEPQVREIDGRALGVGAGGSRKRLVAFLRARR